MQLPQTNEGVFLRIRVPSLKRVNKLSGKTKDFRVQRFRHFAHSKLTSKLPGTQHGPQNGHLMLRVRAEQNVKSH
ncbi:MAG: hypothetical protein A3I66_20590 [Burkholderiales bacterium RIFCSPLOWO2_02_FULL_57_36]|nr:MAG: hypothetical protein A3I66_20590 [Burkholderiales bacterium RIFCSPLOWO2_02_FULL_57_36]